MHESQPSDVWSARQVDLNSREDAALHFDFLNRVPTPQSKLMDPTVTPAATRRRTIASSTSRRGGDNDSTAALQPIIRSDLLRRAERQFGANNVCSVSDIDALRVIVVGSDNGVQLIDCTVNRWVPAAEFEESWQALRRQARLLDSKWDELPVDELTQPSPTLIICRERSCEVVFRTAAGLKDDEELFGDPGHLICVEHDWQDFKSAAVQLTWEEGGP